MTLTVAAGVTSTITFGAQAYTQINLQTFLDIDGNGVLSGNELSSPTSAIVYVDANNNGKFDAGEISTNDNNEPWLTGLRLPNGTYKIRQVVPSGLTETGHGGYNLAGTSTFATDYTLRLPADNPSNDGEMTLYFASGGKPAITGTVFEDRNGNGVFDSSEYSTGYYNDYVYADANGNRKFDTGEDQSPINYDGTFKLYPKPGKYTVRLSYYGGIQQTVALNTSVTVAAGSTSLPVTFGVRVWRDDRIPNFNVTGRVFNDKNKNGIIDAGESGSAYAGWHVYFDIDGTGDFNDNNAYASAVVAADGSYTVPINADGTVFRLLLQNKTGQKYSTPSSYSVKSLTGGVTLTGRNFGLYTV